MWKCVKYKSCSLPFVAAAGFQGWFFGVVLPAIFQFVFCLVCFATLLAAFFALLCLHYVSIRCCGKRNYNKSICKIANRDRGTSSAYPVAFDGLFGFLFRPVDGNDWLSCRMTARCYECCFGSSFWWLKNSVPNIILLRLYLHGTKVLLLIAESTGEGVVFIYLLVSQRFL